MDLICRLCLSVDYENVRNLFENTILLTKITSCLKLELTKADCLPKLVCVKCIEKVEDIYRFNKIVADNQKTLYTHMKKGTESLNLFYSNLQKYKLPVENINAKFIDVGNKEDDNIEEMNVEYLDVEYLEVEYLDDNFDYYDNESEGYKKSVDQIKNGTKSKNKKQKTEAVDVKLTVKIENLEKEPQSASDTDNKEAKVLKTYNYQFKCLTCFEILENRKALLTHYRTVHKPETTDKIEDDEDIEDFIIKEGSNKYKCGKCNNDKVFINKKTLCRHLKDNHKQNRPYICNLCGRTYRDINHIIGHIPAHTNEKLHCSFKCGFSSSHVTCLKVHERVHRGDFKYKCEHCGKGFQVKTWYDEHQNIHNGLKPFSCDICGQAFHLKRYVYKHRTKAHPGAVSGPNRFICLSCSKPCDNKTALNEHMFLEHGIVTQFLCDICGNTFSSADNLKSHKLIHLEIKPHNCSTCNKTFSTRDHLKRHQVSHSGERPYVCDDCGRKYSQRSSLMKHMRKHNKCIKCDKKFTQSAQLIKHQKTCQSQTQTETDTST
ncbi:zinc finger protein 287-like isoform X2 [Pectinophora gossypiella]|uniref:zinc finger protein 287-like isoform X2 n=1 Tax=Pectinophora gossypiella TaxID=13191 RepID=UPI00214E03E1|nr:zinc finger protein 287-like isoform X2 [Pectinophora gossypiella]